MSTNLRAFPVELRASATTLLSTNLQPAHPSLLNSVFDALLHHESRGSIDFTRVAFVCTECRSIGEAASREARDELVLRADLSCCHPRTTVLFRSDQ